jgi:hypothetical protein
MSVASNVNGATRPDDNSTLMPEKVAGAAWFWAGSLGTHVTRQQARTQPTANRMMILAGFMIFFPFWIFLNPGVMPGLEALFCLKGECAPSALPFKATTKRPASKAHRDARWARVEVFTSKRKKIWSCFEGIRVLAHRKDSMPKANGGFWR